MSIENVDMKGKRKTLAKVRLNLTDYFNQDGPISFKLKLRPESTKITAAAINLTIEKSDRDPANVESLSPPPNLLLEEARAEALSIGDDRLLAPSPLGSRSISPAPNHLDLKATSHEYILSEPFVDDSPVKATETSDRPKTPPPLPPRDWEKPARTPSPSPPPSPPEEPKAEPLKVPEPPLETKLVETKVVEEEEVRKPDLSLPLIKEDKPDDDAIFKVPIVVKTPEILEPTRSFSVKVPPSPKMMPNKQSTVEKDLLNWAKDFLKSEKSVKITNLSSSWRNGRGFCALIHHKYPSLIPFKELKMHDMEDNCRMAFEASKLIGVESDLISVEEFTRSTVPDKALVISFLKELKSVLTSGTEEISKEELLEFQCKWFREKGYFRRVVGDMVTQQDEERARLEAEAKEAEEQRTRELEEAKLAEQRKQEQEQFEREREERRKKLYENGQECVNSPKFEPDIEKRQKNIDRVKNLIAEGHDCVEESIQVEVEPNGSVVIETETPEHPDQQPELPPFHESLTIAEELSDLLAQEQQVKQEKEELEEILRDEQNCPRTMMDAMQKKYMQLVNKSHAIVRRQMQLNIEKQMKETTYEINKINLKLQKFSVLDESQKTEVMKNQEQELVSELLTLVNKKDELVLHLDSQEKAIEEDEQILEEVNSIADAPHDNMATLQRLMFFKNKWLDR